MKILQFDTKFKWKIHEPLDSTDSFVGICDRLKLSLQALTLEELLISIQVAITVLGEDLYETGDTNRFCFDRGIAFTIKDYEKEFDVTAAPILLSK